MKNGQLVLRGIIGFAAMITLIFFALFLEGGHLRSQVQVGSFFIVVGGGLALVVAAYGFTPFRQLAQVLRGENIDCWELVGSIKLMSFTGPLLGIVGALLGCIHVMQNLSDPSKLGGGVAIAFISLLYGAFLGLAAYAVWGLVEKSQNTRTESQSPQSAENESNHDKPDPNIATSVAMNKSKVEPVSGGTTLIGLLGFIGCVLLGQALEGGHPSSLVHAGALLIGLGAPLLGAIVIHGFSKPWRQFVDLFSAEDTLAKDVFSLRAVLLFITYASPIIGLIGVILGIIHVMENLSDPSQIGEGTAISFVSLVYGLTLSLIGYTLLAMTDRATLDRKQLAPGLPRGESAHFSMTGFFIVLSLFFIILYSISSFDIQRCKETLGRMKPAHDHREAKMGTDKQDKKNIAMSWASKKSENSEGP